MSQNHMRRKAGRRRLIVLSAALAALSFGISANSAAADPPTGYWVRLINQNSNQCLAVGGASLAGGAGIIQWTCASGALEQEWVIEQSQWSGWFQIVNRKSNMCLAVASSQSTQEGAQVIQYGCDNLYDQAWYFSQNTQTGAYILYNRMSTMVAAVGGASLTAGAPVVQWKSTFGTEQKWFLQIAG